MRKKRRKKLSKLDKPQNKRPLFRSFDKIGDNPDLHNAIDFCNYYKDQFPDILLIAARRANAYRHTVTLILRGEANYIWKNIQILSVVYDTILEKVEALESN
ncbi:hypothetical protein QNI19_26775 [Cytophagaceae bacterium DM2B3-1]|uniref:Uncharacterized protein n=1 Tax=Xanthocytophaga flava TaxID=3048013 RepID=A0ABT7CSR2_9BACT|nr:hypothetical protein [Xanthocytophaga flavus]MDJ1496566.1 hypothetical protein [Xanthocytophaga flavus]